MKVQDADMRHHCWWQIFLPDRGGWFFVYLLFGMLFLRPQMLLWDGGSCRHICNGVIMLTEHHMPSTNYASAIFPNSECFTRSWLADLISGFFYQQAGLTGVVFICSFVIALGLTWSYQMGRARGFGPGSGMIMLSLVMATVGMHWCARSHIYSYLPFLIVYYLLFMAASDGQLNLSQGAKRTIGIAAAMCLWANLHGSFMIGIGMIGLKAIFETIKFNFVRGDNRIVALSQLKWDAIALVCAAGATGINPRGFSLYPHIAGYLSNPMIVHKTDEWRAFDLFAGLGSWAFLLLIAISGYLLWKTKKIPSIAEFILFIGLMLAGFDSMRLIPYWALLAMPIAAPAWQVLHEQYAASPGSKFGEPGEAGSRLQRFIRFETRAGEQEPHGIKIAVGSIIVAAAMGLVMIIAPFSQVQDFDPERLPVGAVDLIRQNQAKQLTQLGFNYDNWGGYLYFKLHRRMFIDDWADFLPVKFVDEYVEMLTAKPGWEEKFNLYHFNWVLVPNESQLAQLLSKSPQWKVLSQDKVAILLIRQLATGAK